MCDQFVEIQNLDILKQISNRYTLYANLYQVHKACEFLCIEPERVQKFILSNWTTVEEIVQCIMQSLAFVFTYFYCEFTSYSFHSNDFFARSVTLLYLAALAPLISENIKVHFLLIESLDSSEDTELIAAIYAIKSVGKHSKSFPSLISDKIYGLVRSKVTDVELKIRLLNVVAEFKPSFLVTGNSLKLCRLLLKRMPSQIMLQSIYNAMTQVAIRSCWAVPKQISFCLSALEKCLSNKALTVCLLQNLARLAVFSQHWNPTQIKKLRALHWQMDQIYSGNVVVTWLKLLIELSSTIHCSAVNDDELPWLKLFESRSMKVRIYALLLSNVVLKQRKGNCPGNCC
uniref:Integrator complex subunit 7 N-terminal domain-containing protein n=1 Tax=Ditylenchus dipsaci TaxID=166011 RepID=A0A915CNK8_9BILA